jgi:hypothetical protein
MTPRDFITFSIGVLAALGSAMVFMFSNFETVKASEQQWKNHIQSNQCAKVSDYRILMERLRWELDNLELTEKQRASKERDFESYQKQVDKLDPKGMC